jgi:Large polyvalent protein-associated domain 7
LSNSTHREEAMDTDHSPARNSRQVETEVAAASQGGTVEPAKRATIAKELFQTPVDVPGERYELRDPFADVTYRANSWSEIVAKADQLGSSRFVAVDAEGQRTTVQKVEGEWRRGPQRSAAPERPLEATPPRDEVPQATNVVSLPKAPGPPEVADAKAIAKIDAQADRAARVARLESALMDRYLIKRAPVTIGEVTMGRTEYRFRGDTSRVAFTESTFRLATDTNSPSVARSMVDVAEARNWRALRVSGHEDFKRLVWLEASVRGVKTQGYEPNPGDLDVLKKEQEARRLNRIEAAPVDRPNSATTPAEQASARSGGGRKAVLAAIEAVLVAKRVPAKQREAVLAAATEKLAQRIREGRAPQVRVYDKAAPSQRPIVMPTPDVQRTRERAVPVR